SRSSRNPPRITGTVKAPTGMTPTPTVVVTTAATPVTSRSETSVTARARADSGAANSATWRRAARIRATGPPRRAPPRSAMLACSVTALPWPYAENVTTGRRSGGHRGDEGAAAALTGGGPSQLGVNGSMRARDVSRPTEKDVAAAEKL